MSETLTVEQKIAFAESASLIDVELLEDFCTERGLPLQDVTYWSTAYHTGGELGVQAMVLHWLPERAQGRAWHEEVKNAVKTFRPRRLRVVKDGNRFTAEEIKPLTHRNIVYTPIFQLRVVQSDDSTEHWFLYWKRADGSWWPYAGRPTFTSVKEAVAEVQADPHRCFRLHPLH
jgi:hypothetical protein